MPTKKKKAFTKDNSVKFLLLQGNPKAENADGETLENVLVPISTNYKPGTSLFMTRIAEIVNESNPPRKSNDEADLENILDQFGDTSVSEDEGPSQNINKQLKNINIGDHVKRFGQDDIIIEEEFEDDGDSYSDYSGDSDADCSFKQDCPENLKILEEQMRKKLKEYQDDQFGALDDEEICGYLTGGSERIDQFIQPPVAEKEEEIELGKCEESLKEKILQYSEMETEESAIEIVREKPLEYDCESIISTYSNKYNHPTLIREAGKIKKIIIPANPLKKQLTKSKLKQLEIVEESDSEEDSDDDIISIASTVNNRPKGETPEQRRERKNLVKELRREKRILKKENKLVFKNEKKLEKCQAINLQNNRGITLH